MWNNLNLESPSHDLVDYLPQDNFRFECVQSLITELTSAANTCTSENPLWNEIDILKDLQEKCKHDFLCNKFLTNLHRICHCLKKMVLLNLSKNILDLVERFLNGFKQDYMTACLPSRRQVEYILLRIQSAAKLVCEVINYSQDIFCLIKSKHKNGSLNPLFERIASLTDNLNIMFRNVLEMLCEKYQNILRYRLKLKSGVDKWSESVDLPLNLKQWIIATESLSSKSTPIKKSSFDTSPILQEKNDCSDNVYVSSDTEDDSDTDSVIVIESEKEDLQSTGIETKISDDEENKPWGRSINDVMHGVINIQSKKSKKSSHQLKGTVPCVVDDNSDIDLIKEPYQPSVKLKNKQKLILERILAANSFKKLESVWFQVCCVHERHLLIKLTVKRKKVISNFLKRVKKNYKQKVKLPKNVIQPKRFCFHSDNIKLALYLGFTEGHINFYRNRKCSMFSHVTVQTVRTYKMMKVLYRQLHRKLQAGNKIEQCKKLKAIFKLQSSNIRLLLKNGEKQCARKMISSACKVMLTVFKP